MNFFKCDLKECIMNRTLICTLENGTQVADSLCSLNEKPVSSQRCYDSNDCRKYQKYLVESNYNHSLLYTGVLGYSNWSRCSAKCGPGIRSREPLCFLASKQSILLPISYCNTEKMETLTQQCHLTNCSYVLIQKWGRVKNLN
jgi:hypothetical protein